MSRARLHGSQPRTFLLPLLVFDVRGLLLPPGDPFSLYHRVSQEGDFLVLKPEGGGF
jgi:hypothetical protein